MSGIQNIPLRIPTQWSAEWFDTFVREVLAKLDTRNSVGTGIAAPGVCLCLNSGTNAIAITSSGIRNDLSSDEPP